MTKTNSFREYIRNRRITDTPACDFVSDARSDPTLPDAETWDELRCYLSGRTRHPAVLRAAKTVWRQFTEQRVV